MLKRGDENFISLIWWNIDRWLLGLIVIISFVGIILLSASSPALAKKIGLNDFYFVKRQFFHFIIGFGCMFFITSLSLEKRRLFVQIGFYISLIALIYAFFSGIGYKGARRWLSILGLSIQPSEFTKVFLVSFCALHISKWQKCINYHYQKKHISYYPGHIITIVATILTVIITIFQPDIAMSVIILSSIILLFFLAGLPIRSCFYFFILLLIGIGIAYYFFPHVNARINNFILSKNIDPWGDGYQITKALNAVANGGFFGVGIGEGIIKNYLPDSHSDFIFVVAAEEMGFVFCVILLIIFSLIIWRCLNIALRMSILSEGLTVSVLTAQFALQVIVNVASNIRLIPTTGVTLPFISYGGSSIIANFILMGLILSFSKNK